MKHTTSKNIILKVAAIEAIRKQFRELAERESELKSSLKAFMGNSTALQAGDYVITLTAVQRATIDSKGLKARYPEIIEEFTTMATYQVLKIAK